MPWIVILLTNKQFQSQPVYLEYSILKERWQNKVRQRKKKCSCKITSVALICLPTHLCGSLRRILCRSLYPGVCSCFALLFSVCSSLYPPFPFILSPTLLVFMLSRCMQCWKCVILVHMCSKVGEDGIFKNCPLRLRVFFFSFFGGRVGRGGDICSVLDMKGLLIRFWEKGARKYWFSITSNMNH